MTPKWISSSSATVRHGSARVTYDLDICYSRAAINLRRLASALAPFHPRPRGFSDELPFIWDERTLRNGTVFTLRTDLGGIDLLAEVAGLGTYDEAKACAIVVEAFDRRVATLDFASLIRTKRAVGEPPRRRRVTVATPSGVID